MKQKDHLFIEPELDEDPSHMMIPTKKKKDVCGVVKVFDCLVIIFPRCPGILKSIMTSVQNMV